MPPPDAAAGTPDAQAEAQALPAAARYAGDPAVEAVLRIRAGVGQAVASQQGLHLRARIETRLREIYPAIRFHGQVSPRLPNTTNFAIPGLPGETLVIAADLAGLALSTGSACASGAVEPSHVIRAMGFGDAEARGAVRLSLGWSTVADDVERFLDRFPRVVERVREGLANVP